MNPAPKLITCAAVGLWLAVFTHAAARAASQDEPDGLYVCEGVYIESEKQSWRTVVITVGDDLPRAPDAHPDASVQVYGLGETNASYMFSPEQLVVFAPHTCLVGESTRRFTGCAYVGIIGLTDGSFAFYKGDYPGGELFFAGIEQSEKICVKAE
jgi:hypothetical protein